MDKLTLRLAVDEVAMALTQIGQPDMARGLLLSATRDAPNADIIRGRLRAAGHSLMARGLLEVDPEGGVRLDERLRFVAQTFARADFSLRLSQARGGRETLETYHFKEGHIIRHTVERDLIHAIDECISADEVVDGSLAFFAVEDQVAGHVKQFRLAVPTTSNPLAAARVDELKAALARAGVEDDTSRAFLSDLDNEVSRGSILRVDYDDDNQPISDNGALILRGPERLWLMRILLEDGGGLLVMPGSTESLREEVMTLLGPVSGSRENKQ